MYTNVAIVTNCNNLKYKLGKQVNSMWILETFASFQIQSPLLRFTLQEETYDPQHDRIRP